MDNQEIRSIMLRKFYDYNQEKPRHSLEFEEFVKMGLTNEQIVVNAKYLHEKGLLEVTWGLGQPLPSFGRITAFGMDVVEGPETVGGQFPFVQNNIQIIRGNVSHSLIAQSAGGQTINISESFNQIYSQIDTAGDIDSPTKEELKKDVKEIEEHLNKGKIDLEWIKEKSSKIKEKTSWISPILQNIITEAAKKYLGL